FSFADLNEPDISDIQAPEDPRVVADPFASEGDAKETPAATASGETGNTEAMMRQELESVDFYIQQRYYDIATDTLDLLERQFGPHDEIAARRKKLGSTNESAPI